MSDVTTKPKRIYFVRHGEALGNATNISQDATTPLTDTGHAQAKVVAERVAGLGIDHVYTSNMVRAIETGSYIAKTLGLYPEASELFREWSTPESVRGKHHDSPEYEAWLEELTTGYDDPSWRFEDAENFADLLKRAEEGVELLESSQHQHILVVSHGKFLRFFLTFILLRDMLTPRMHLQADAALRMSNTGITVFEITGGVWRLVTWNDIAHFAE